MALKIKLRCFRCLKVLREDGTCQNPECVRYTPGKEDVAETAETSEVAETTETAK